MHQHFAGHPMAPTAVLVPAAVDALGQPNRASVRTLVGEFRRVLNEGNRASTIICLIDLALRPMFNALSSAPSRRLSGTANQRDIVPLEHIKATCRRDSGARQWITSDSSDSRFPIRIIAIESRICGYMDPSYSTLCSPAYPIWQLPARCRLLN